MSDPWGSLRDELMAWRRAGRWPTIWLRDDDAVAASEPLDRLLVLGLPTLLAVIPAALEASLIDRLQHAPHAWVAQHGYSHTNYATPDQKKAELGTDRPLEAVLAELAEGQRALSTLPQRLPVLVPPWNRIAPAVIAALPGLGFRGVSTYGPRRATLAAPGLTQINTHADLIDWQGTRGFAGEAAVLAALVRHLSQRRLRTVDADEPTGLLCHHLVHDAACWAFLEQLQAMPGLIWLPGNGLWPPS